MRCALALVGVVRPRRRVSARGLGPVDPVKLVQVVVGQVGVARRLLPGWCTPVGCEPPAPVPGSLIGLRFWAVRVDLGDPPLVLADAVADPEEAVRIATAIGYPVMLKASAGGGGKGMRIAWNEREAREGFQSSKNEAAASFGDDRIFIEKFVTEPRHIEIQVLGDKHGNVIHLGERECSIQRRLQKVIEEAPSPFLTPETRAAMGAQAVQLAKAVNYESAGTVEFIVDKDRNFYFLEMNTRLQVEHPVTELITGIDLVEQMIRVAAGEKLSITQNDVKLNGWAVESRIYAEDPYRNFLPSIGRLTRYRPPAEGRSGGRTIRNDTGVYEGGEISLYYDPMIAKLCVHAPTRGDAIEGMADALDAFDIDGIQHNVAFLAAVMGHPRFRSGSFNTGFIAEEYPDGFHGAAVADGLPRALAAIAGFVATAEADRARRVDGQLGDRLEPPHVWQVTIGGTPMKVKVGTKHIKVEGDKIDIALEYTPGDRLVIADIDGAELAVKLAKTRTGWRMTTRGRAHDVRVLPWHAAPYARHMIEKVPPDLSKYLICPMPGLLVSLHVGEGDKVEAGQPLATVEAMKMENILRAEKAGVVARVNAAQGDSLAVDAVILEMA